MVNKGTIVLRFDSKTRRDERDAKLAEQINNFCCNNPDLVSEYHLLVDERTLTTTQHGLEHHELEHVPYEDMLRENADMPRITPEQMAVIERYSQRMRAIEELRTLPARVQPDDPEVSARLRAIEGECYGHGQSRPTREESARLQQPSRLSQALQALERECVGTGYN